MGLSKMRESVKEKKVQKRYDEEFKRQAVELVIHSGKTQAQIARELGVSEYSLTLWKKDYLGRLKPAQLDGGQMSPEQMLEQIRQLQKELSAQSIDLRYPRSRCSPRRPNYCSSSVESKPSRRNGCVRPNV
jgi:transposase